MGIKNQAFLIPNVALLLYKAEVESVEEKNSHTEENSNSMEDTSLLLLQA